MFKIFCNSTQSLPSSRENLASPTDPSAWGRAKSLEGSFATCLKHLMHHPSPYAHRSGTSPLPLGEGRGVYRPPPSPPPVVGRVRYVSNTGGVISMPQ